MARRRRTWTLVALLLALFAAPRTHAHPDVRLFDETLRLAPGEAVVRPMAVHYHRLVATWTVDAPAAEGLWLMVVPAEERGAAGASPDAAWVAARLEDHGRVSRLIGCCLDVPYRHLLLVVRNDGDVPVDVALRAWAVHDDFAVIAARAEPGAVEVPLALFALVGAVSVRAALRDRRREDAAGRARGRALSWSAALFAAALLIAAGLATAGAVRYGAGPVDGMIAVLADVPVPGGLFGSRAASVLGVLLLTWLAAVGAWVRAVGQGDHRTSRGAVALGAALACVSLASGVAMGWTYGGSLVPVGLAVVLAAPVLVSVGLLRRTAVPVAVG